MHLSIVSAIVIESPVIRTYDNDNDGDDDDLVLGLLMFLLLLWMPLDAGLKSCSTAAAANTAAAAVADCFARIFNGCKIHTRDLDHPNNSPQLPERQLNQSLSSSLSHCPHHPLLHP